MKNKVTTLGYFIKRLKDNGFIVWKMFNKYSESDTRIWTVLINPGEESIYITCSVNIGGLGSIPVFEFHDGKQSLNRTRLSIATESMEVVINHLIKHGVCQDSELFTKKI